MKAYWIAHVEVTDPKVYGEYIHLATEAIEAHGGRFLARGGEIRILEGNCKPRNVLVEFPDLESAENCYNSETYRQALSYSGKSSDRDVILLQGV